MAFYEKDTLMRQIKEFAAFLAIVMRFKERGNLDDALAQINDSIQVLLNEKMEEWDDLSPKDFLDECLNLKPHSTEKIPILAEWLYQKGLILMEQKDLNYLPTLEKALCLFQYAHESDGIYSLDRIEKMKHISTLIQ